MNQSEYNQWLQNLQDEWMNYQVKLEQIWMKLTP